MVGSAIVRELQRQGYTNIITRTHAELDLTRQEAVEKFFAEEKPEYVFLAAAKVGGIIANQTALADFMYENMILEMNVIHSAWMNGCKKLEFLGSSCIYPRMAPQPMKEDCLLTSELEKTNEAYALAKISGLKYCEYLRKGPSFPIIQRIFYHKPHRKAISFLPQVIIFLAFPPKFSPNIPKPIFSISSVNSSVIPKGLDLTDF